MSAPTTAVEIPLPEVTWERVPLDIANPPHPPVSARRHIANDPTPLAEIVEGICSACGADNVGPEDRSCCGSRILTQTPEVDDLRPTALI